MRGIVRPVLLLVLFVSSVMLGSYLAAEDRRRVEALSESDGSSHIYAFP